MTISDGTSTGSSSDTTGALLASVLRGEAFDPEPLAGTEAEQQFLTAAAEHGVDCVLRHLLKQRGSWLAVPPSLRTALDDRAHSESAVEMCRRHELTRALKRLRDAGVDSLILKGAGLAYTHYPAPYLRPCSDVDLLIRRNQKGIVAIQLEALGYTRVDSMSRDAVHTQSSFEVRRGSLRHVIDLHWAISNRPLFAEMLSFEELAGNAVAVPVLGQGAVTLAPVDALLFACIHRVAHHNDSHLLIWLFDIKLLAEGLSPNEWDQFVELAIRKQLVAVCQETLAVTASLLDGCSEGLRRFDRLEYSGRTPEPSAAYIGGVRSRVRSLALDLKGAAGATAKMRLLAAHAFPAPAYMRNKYRATSRIRLISAYAHRAAAGAWGTIKLPMARTRIAAKIVG